MICLNCLTNEASKFKGSKYCSRKCSAQARVKNPEYISKLSDSAKLAKREPLSESHKRNIANSLKLVNPKTTETKNKISTSRKGQSTGSRKGIKMPINFWNDERKANFSANNKGGRCKWYEFIKNDKSVVKLQGSYEMRFALILNTVDPNWIKPTIHDRQHQFKWIDSTGTSHWYTPDFWSPKLNKYFEIKGFWPKSFEEKRILVESLSDIVKIIYKKDLENIEINKTIY